VLPGEGQLGRVLHGDHALGGRDARGQGVKERGLARAGATGDDHIEAGRHCPRQQLDHVGRRKGGQGDGPGAEAPNGEAGPVDGQGRHNGVDAGAVGQAGVDQWRRPVDPQAQRGDDLLDEVLDGLGVEDNGDAHHGTVALHPDPTRPVHHDLGDRRVTQERLERPQAAHVGQDASGQAVTRPGAE